MDNNKKILFIINNEFYQLQDRLMKNGFDSSLVLLVINGMRAKALEETHMILLSDVAQAEVREQESANPERGE